MTVAQLRNLARFWLDDVNGGYFTDAQMLVLLNNAQRECQKLLLQAGEDFYTVCATALTTTGQQNYALPDDFVKLMRIERLISGTGDSAFYERLYPITRNEQDVTLYYNNGAPNNFIINKDTFSLLPVPDQAYTLHLWYAYRVEDMVNDNDEPDVPEDYQEYIAIMAARDGFLRDGRTLQPIESKLLYFETMMKENSERRNEDSPRMVVCTTGGDWDVGW